MAFNHEEEFDGAMTISQTESACEIEQDGGFQLKDIHFDTLIKDGQTFLINKGGFDRQLFDRLSNLHFVEIKGSDNPATVRKTKEDASWTFICDSQIFENNLTKRVMVFGKKTF